MNYNGKFLCKEDREDCEVFGLVKGNPTRKVNLDKVTFTDEIQTADFGWIWILAFVLGVAGMVTALCGVSSAIVNIVTYALLIGVSAFVFIKKAKE